MKCGRCSGDNPPGQRFCGDCGAALASGCPGCGALQPAGQRFCGDCGAPLGLIGVAPRFAKPGAYTPSHLAEKILTSRAALEGERKQVTVLFADLKGSMELLADRDPEDARQILDPVLELMMEAVHNYRPEYHHRWGSKTYYTQLTLDPLPPETAEELLHALLGENPQLQPLRRLLVERTERNPFFLEESVRALIETGVLGPQPEVEAAERYLREAVALGAELGMRPLVAHCHLGFGNLYRRTGKPEQAIEYLITATKMYREMDLRLWLAQAEAEMRECSG